MAVHTAVTVSPEDFVLERTLATARDVRVELERFVPLSSEGLAPYVRVESDDPDRVTGLIREEPAVDGATVLERGDGERLLRVDWTDRGCELAAALRDTEAACVRAVAADGTWSLSLRFPTHDRLARWYHRCRERGVSVGVERVREATGSGSEEGRTALTDRQQEALCVALDEGYFDVPRGVTLGELAERLDVSDTAASQRIRRGVRGLLAEALAADAR